MASLRFSVCHVCDIIAGDDGESEYMFPGSDDELEMGDFFPLFLLLQHVLNNSLYCA